MVDRPADAGAGGRADTLLGHSPEHGDPITLGADELRVGTYIEGAVPEQQTALCTNLMAQWARAGAGFCYVHPDAFATLDVLAALPADRLDDVVWLNLRPRRLPDQLGVDTDHQPAVDPTTVAEGVPRDACVTPPAAARVGDWLDVLAADETHADWNLGHVLAAVLDRAVSADMTLTDLVNALNAAGYDAMYTDDEVGVDVLCERLGDQPGADWTAGIRRAERLDADVYKDAQHLLANATLYGEALSPLRGPSSCSLPELVADDAIILVTGDLPAADATGLMPRMRRLATHLLATVIVRRVWEGVQAMAAEHEGEPSLYPVVLDDVTRLFAHEPRLLQALLTDGTDPKTPLAVVCNGRAPGCFGDEIEGATMHSVPTRLRFEERASDDTARALRTDTDVMERVFAAAEEGAIAPPATCWLDRDAAGLVGSLDDLGGFEQLEPVGPPEPVQSQDAVGAAIERSRERHGTPHPIAGHLGG